MTSLRDFLRYVPIIRGEIIRNEVYERRREEYKRKKSEIMSRMPEIERRVLTISPEQLASMQERKVSDYEPIGLNVVSPEVHSAEYSESYALANLLDKINTMGIEFVVSIQSETITNGIGSMINPHGYQTKIYGTGMRLKK